MLRDDLDLFGRGGALDQPLSSPSAVLVVANGCQCRSDPLDHGNAQMRRGVLAQLLNDSVTDVVAGELRVRTG